MLGCQETVLGCHQPPSEGILALSGFLASGNESVESGANSNSNSLSFAASGVAKLSEHFCGSFTLHFVSISSDSPDSLELALSLSNLEMNCTRRADGKSTEESDSELHNLSAPRAHQPIHTHSIQCVYYTLMNADDKAALCGGGIRKY